MYHITLGHSRPCITSIHSPNDESVLASFVSEALICHTLYNDHALHRSFMYTERTLCLKMLQDEVLYP